MCGDIQLITCNLCNIFILSKSQATRRLVIDYYLQDSRNFRGDNIIPVSPIIRSVSCFSLLKSRNGLDFRKYHFYVLFKKVTLTSGTKPSAALSLWCGNSRLSEPLIDGLGHTTSKSQEHRTAGGTEMKARIAQSSTHCGATKVGVLNCRCFR